MVPGELGQHPVDHRLPVEVRRRGRRFVLGRAEGLTDGVEQVKPEKLGVMPVAAYLHDDEPASRAGTFGPGAQQRRLPAAGRSRDGRHLPRCHAVEAGDEIVAGDQWLAYCAVAR